MVRLYILQLFGKLCLLFHVTRLFLAASITHLLPNIIHMILVHWIVMFEKTHSLLPCITFISVITWLILITDSTTASWTTFERLEGRLIASRIVALPRWSRLVNWFHYMRTLIDLILWNVLAVCSCCHRWCFLQDDGNLSRFSSRF